MGFTIEQCIFFHLAKAHQLGSKFFSGCVSKFNLTPVQAMVLSFLGQEDTITASELGRRTYLDSATLTGILDRLEAAGWLKRQRHPDDRRAIHICLTEPGKSLANKVSKEAAAANDTFLSSLSLLEKEMLFGLLKKVREASLAG
jgi:MarR family transcriptional regulator, organic hydroperoxide resistance regulator